MQTSKSPRLNDLALLFKALSDPTRLRLLGLLADGEVCVCFLCAALKLVQPTVSRHLAYLKRAGLVAARREGQWTHYRWATQADPLAHDLLAGLRDGLAKNKDLRRERAALKRACC